MDLRRGFVHCGFLLFSLSILFTLGVSLSDGERQRGGLMPALLWSTEDAFVNAEGSYVKETVEVVDLVSTLSALGGNQNAESGLKKYINSDAKPVELVVAFLFPELSTSELSELVGAFDSKVPAGSFLRTVVEHGGARSLAIPSVFVENGDHGLFADYRENKDVKKVEEGDLESFLAKDLSQSVLSDGVMQILLVPVSSDKSFKELDTLLQETTQKLSALGGEEGGPVLSLLSARRPPQGLAYGRGEGGQADLALMGLSASVGQRRLANEDDDSCPTGYYKQVDADGRSFCFSHYVYITPTILAGILISLFLAAIAIVYLQFLMDIRGPERFAARYPPKGKEF